MLGESFSFHYDVLTSKTQPAPIVRESEGKWLEPFLTDLELALGKKSWCMEILMTEPATVTEN